MSVWREPTLHFVVLGGLLFGAYAWLSPVEVDPVQVTPALRDALSRQIEQRTGAAASAEAVEAAVSDWVDRELMYREALRLGLDRGDPIVRRRLVQKLEFLAEDAPASAPTDAELQAFLDAHAADFSDPARVSFEHVFFRRGRAELPGADPEANQRLVEAGGDPFVHGRVVTRRTAKQVAGLFGNDLADALPALETGTWSGPVKSAYGTHLVRITARHPGAVAKLEEVRAKVVARLAETRRAEARAALVKRLRAARE